MQVVGSLADRASAALGLPFDGESGGYRFDALADYDRQLLRGLLEGCGTVCFKSDDEAVGISFVHEDERLLRTIPTRLTAVRSTRPTTSSRRPRRATGSVWPTTRHRPR